MDKTTSNQRIKLLRSHLNISQSEFAIKIETSITGLSKIENDLSTPRKSTLNKIAEEFGVSKDWLINGIGEMTFEKKELPAKETNPWRDALVQQLQEEVSFLREIVSNMSKSKSGSFLKDIAPAGFFGSEKMSNIVRVS